MMRVILLLVAAFLGAPTSAFPQVTAVLQTTPGTGASTYQAPPRDTAAKTGTARIRGHVYAAEDGAPLRRAQVRIFAPELRETRSTSTDERGVFEFRDLPGGRYTVTAGKGSFVSLQYGQTRPSQAGRPLQILDGQTVEKVDFALPRGGIITGRVVDDFGEAVADIQVAALQPRFVQGRRQLMRAGGHDGTTNDIGEFRLFGLPPGQYYISATHRNFSGGGDSDDRSGYATTYYPGTANPVEAQRVRVEVGQVVSDMNITLVATRTATVAGSATDSQGRPLTAGSVMVMPRGASAVFLGAVGGGPIKRDGTFTVSGLSPGEYRLRANVTPTTDGVAEFATADITVNGEDFSDVHLMVTKLVTAAGRVIVQDPTAAQSLRLPIRITLSPVNPDDVIFGGGGGNVKEDFTFELKTSPGKFRLFVGTPPAWTLKAVRDNGIDVTDSGIEFREGGDTNGLEVELTNRVSDLSGLVSNTRGEVVKDYTVMVFAQDRERWGTNTRYRGLGRPDQDGRYKVRGLPAGDYYVIALDYVDLNEVGDPNLLERLSTKSTAFTLGDGETKSLDLKVQTGA